MYTDLETIGWYTATGAVKSPTPAMASADEPTEDDLKISKEAITQLCENPLLLLLNPHSKSAIEKKKIPFFLFEAGQLQPNFVPVDFSMASSDSEQIAVDGLTRAIDPDQKLSTASQGMVAPVNALNILRGKINFIIQAV